MKKIDNPLHYDFPFSGSCALEAIGAMFNLDVEGVLLIMKLAGWRKRVSKEGVSTIECRRAIRILCAAQKKVFWYTKNTQKLSVREFVRKYRRGRFLLNQDGHVSCYKNGVLIDGFSPTSYDLYGWWEIKDKTSKKEPNCVEYDFVA